MVSATVQDIIRRYKQAEFGAQRPVRESFDSLPEKVSRIIAIINLHCKGQV